MKARIRPGQRHREPTIALVNIVFLMLVFFLVAGTIARPLDPGLALVRTVDLEGAPPPDALVLHPDGRLSFNGDAVASESAFLAALPDSARDPVRVMPDRDLPARRLVAVAGALRAAGAGRILIVTERGLP